MSISTKNERLLISALQAIECVVAGSGKKATIARLP